MNENTEHTKISWSASKAVHRGKFVAAKIYIFKTVTSQISIVTFHLKTMEKKG